MFFSRRRQRGQSMDDAKSTRRKKRKSSAEFSATSWEEGDQQDWENGAQSAVNHYSFDDDLDPVDDDDDDDDVDDVDDHGCNISNHHNHQQGSPQLTSGQVRFIKAFAGSNRPVNVQMESLSKPQLNCLKKLKHKWEKRNPELPFSNEMYLQFARCSPGGKSFQTKAAWNVMKHFDHRYLSLTAEVLEPQLLTKTLFPLPGLKTKNNQNMFYMRPSRYVSRETPTEDILDNLAYCMQTMNTAAAEDSCVNGIGFLANMNDFNMKRNFTREYCRLFMAMLQGNSFPTKVELFLIVNPPAWFGAVWKLMKPMLSSTFQKKVKMISEKDLGLYLQDGYQSFLPDEMADGQMKTETLVRDFVNYRKFIEEQSY